MSLRGIKKQQSKEQKENNSGEEGEEGEEKLKDIVEDTNKNA
jgi:hypothetical protein